MRIERWSIDSALAQEAQDNYRTSYARRLEGISALQIMRDLTFDGVVPTISFEQVTDFFEWLNSAILPKPMAGIGLEVGAGPLVLSSLIAQASHVTTMYGVEVCAPLIDQLAPIVVSEILGVHDKKMVGVIGSFDAMELPDNSVDFVFDFFSLHHALDIGVTLKEISRILKPGGMLIMLDKARPDEYTDADIEMLLDHEYDTKYKIQFGIPHEQKLTRRMNGEREYRLQDWNRAMVASNLNLTRFYNVQQTSGGGVLRRWYKQLISMLPLSIQVFITNLVPQKEKQHNFILDSKHTIYSSFANPLRKELSVLVAEKI